MANPISLTMATGYNAATMGFVGVVIGSVQRATFIASMILTKANTIGPETKKQIHKINFAVNIIGTLASIAFLSASIYLYGLVLVNSALIAAVLAIAIMVPYALVQAGNVVNYYHNFIATPLLNNNRGSHG